MFHRSKNKRAGLCLMVVVACLALAALCTVLVMPETALAAKGGGNGNGGGNGKGDDKIAYFVDAVADVSDHDPCFEPLDQTLSSTCSGLTSETSLYTEWPGSPEECIVITPTGSSYALTNDPTLIVGMKKGKIISWVQFYIQDVAGPDGIQHSSDPIPVVSPVERSSAGFTLHLHADGVPVWRRKGHTGGPIEEMIGTISVGDIVFTPVAPAGIALAGKPDRPGGKGKFETMLYWVAFSEDPFAVFWSHQITGRLENPDNPRIIVNRVYGGERAHIQPKNLRLTDGFDFVPGADGSDDFDTAFPETTYDGTLIINSDGATAQMELTALSRAGKKQHYMLTAQVDAAPENWNPLGMQGGESTTVALWAWQLQSGTGSPSKAVHAWGDFNGEVQITIERRP